MSRVNEDRRREARTQASGVVRIVIAGGSFEGELLDVSAGGFRVVHGQTSLERGAEVDFRHRQAKGKARVVWNRVVAGHVETGFLVL